MTLEIKKIDQYFIIPQEAASQFLELVVALGYILNPNLHRSGGFISNGGVIHLYHSRDGFMASCWSSGTGPEGLNWSALPQLQNKNIIDLRTRPEVQPKKVEVKSLEGESYAVTLQSDGSGIFGCTHFHRDEVSKLRSLFEEDKDASNNR